MRLSMKLGLWAPLRVANNLVSMFLRSLETLLELIYKVQADSEAH